jgi:AI-2 transport protein TqsA
MSERENGESWMRRPVLWLLTVIVVILSGWALRATATVMVPVVLSLFLALLVYPVDRLASERLPSWLGWLGHALALCVVLLVLLGFAGCLWLAAGQLIDRFEGADYRELLPSMDVFEEGEADTEGGSMFREVYSQATESLASAMVESIPGFAQNVLNMAGTTLAGLILVLFLTLMMLIEAPRWRAKLETAASKRASRDLENSMVVIADRLRRYLLTRVVVGLLTAALYVGWLWIFDLDLLLVWGLLAFLLNFIPTFGSMIAGVLVVAYAFAQKDPGTAFLIGTGIFAIEQVMGNFVDPRLQGRQVSVSPLVILVVLVLWSWIWGVVGALLAVPIVVAVVILFSHIHALRPVALFLSNECTMEDLDRMTLADGEKK